MQKQYLGDQTKLKSGPGTVLPENKTPFPLQKSGGDHISKMSLTPDTTKYGAGTPDGKRQDAGADHMKLNDKPISGWNSYNTPMSERDKAGKKNF